MRHADRGASLARKAGANFALGELNDAHRSVVRRVIGSGIDHAEFASVLSQLEVAMASRLHIKGLPRGFDEDDLLDLCEPYGFVEDVQVIYDDYNGSGTVRGIVDYPDRDDAKSAADDLDGYELDDQPLRVTVSSRKGAVSAFE
jgi:RNA recognition motif-containing protein